MIGLPEAAITPQPCKVSKKGVHFYDRNGNR